MKRTVILAGRDGRPSMRLVYGQMNTADLDIVRTPRRGSRYIRHYAGNNAETHAKQPISNLAYEGHVIIRWGNRIPVETDNHTITYNKSEAIKTATDKKLSREIFMREGVRTSRLVTPENVTPSQYPIIARPFTHSKGKNFVVIHNQAAFTGHYNANSDRWYYSEFIDKEREFRVHCAHGKVLDVMEKPKASGIAWNRAQNHEAFVRVKQEDYIHDVCLQALKATQALGLDFAGVDVLLKDGLAYVLEANTSPTLNSSEHVSKRYAKYFNWLARSDDRRPHYNYTEWKKPTSFAWKYAQLDG
jgi:glutathione synthase/RimK-type ligase-like ATP-grasp enzyme